MLLIRAVCISGALLLGQSLSAQAWLKDLETKKASSPEGEFYRVQKAFDAYWEGKEIEKGKGWKQFRRWENFMEPRVYPSGNLNLPSLLPEIEKIRNAGSLPANWESLGPSEVPPKAYSSQLSGAGRINTIAFHPENNDILWAGSPSGGFWKTTDGGLSWFTTTDDLFSIGVSDIAVNPDNPDILYIATGDGDAGDTYAIGVLKSVDGGMTFSPTGFQIDYSDRNYFRRILINPLNTNELIVSTNTGIYKTNDGFNTVTLVEAGRFKDLEFKPGNPEIVYATKYDPAGTAGIFRSADGGDSFTRITQGLDLLNNTNRIELAVTPADPSLVYAIASDVNDDGFYGFYKSTNSGISWTKVYGKDDPDSKNLLGWSFDGEDEGGQGWYDLSLAVSPVNPDIVLAGGVNVWKSINGGESFFLSAHWIGFNNIDYVHADHHMLVYRASTNEVFSCNDGGIYVSSNDGADWKDRSEGLSILQIYRISASAGLYDLFLTGNQDNGSMRRSAGNWSEVTGGDGMDNLIDPQNPDNLITSIYYGSFFLSTDGGENFNLISPEEADETGAWITPIQMSKTDPAVLYAGYSDVYKSNNRGSSWTKLSSNLTGGTNLRSLAVSSANEEYIYAATYGRIYMTSNGGIEWKDVTDGLPAGAIVSVEVAPNNPEELWVSISGFSEGEKVYYSPNAGKSWKNYSEGLPNLPVNVIRYKNNSARGLYAGTEIGIFYRDQFMDSWQAFNEGLPNVIVNDLEIQDNWNRIIAGTYGRGLWASDVYLPENPLFAEIYAESRYICLGSEARFRVETPGNPDSIVWTVAGEKINTDDGEFLNYTFESTGLKDLGVSVYKNGDSIYSEFNNYVRVIEEPSLSISGSDLSSVYKSDLVTIFVSGAEEYTWEPSDIIVEDNGNSVIVSLEETTDLIVTGTVGSCTSTDTLTIPVKPGPQNDDPCGAIEIVTGLNGPFSNVNATALLDEPLPDTTDCNTQYTWCNQEGGIQNSVWFTFTPIRISNTFITEGFDTQIAIYEAENCEDLLSPGEFTLVAANDDYFGFSRDYAAALDQIRLDPGTTYWIQVDGSAGGEEGEFYITIHNSPVNTPEVISQDDPGIRVFPNPSDGDFRIGISGINGESELTVYDISGRMILTRLLEVNGQTETNIILQEKGIYLLRVRQGNKVFTERIMVD